MENTTQKTRLIDLSRQKIGLDDGKIVFTVRCADCRQAVKARLPLKAGQIPVSAFAIKHIRKGKPPCRPTHIRFITDGIPGMTPDNPLDVNVSIEDPMGRRHGAYRCLCSERVRFSVMVDTGKQISHPHETCGLVTHLRLKLNRRHERRTDVNDHVIVSFDADYGLMGKIVDFSEGGSRIKLPLKREEQAVLNDYLKPATEIQLIQYTGDIRKTDFPNPYKMNRDDFGFPVLKLNRDILSKPAGINSKIYRKAVIVNYAFNPMTQKAELRLKFLA